MAGIPKFLISMIDDLSIIAQKLAPNSVITSKIANLSVTTAKIADKAVTLAKLADEVTALLGGGGSLPFVHDFRASTSFVPGTTFVDLGDEDLVVPEDGVYVCLFHGYGSLNTTSASDFIYGWAIDGADPLDITQQDLNVNAKVEIMFHIRVYTLTAGQTLRMRMRRVLGSGTTGPAGQTHLIFRLGDAP